MPGHARKDIVREGQIGVYHTWSRCVQRAHLCGFDPLTGQDFEHRRVWIKTLLEYQASVFAVDVGNYTILSNHQHLIARTRPDIAATWTDEEVAWRWKRAWPAWQDGQWIREPTDQEIEEVLAQRDRLPQLRAHLSSLSWFMARWKEPIARLANQESGTKGHFYEQRFGSRELVDDGANLCCNVYLDLNQVQAGLARSLEESTCSAIYDRLVAWRQRETQASLEEFRASASEGYVLEYSDVEGLLADCFLAPIRDQGPALVVDAGGASRVLGSPVPAERVPAGDRCQLLSVLPIKDAENEDPKGEQEQDLSEGAPDALSAEASAVVESTAAGGEAGHKPRQRPQPTWKVHQRLQRHRRRRASDHAFLGIPLEQYLGLVQWTAQQVGADSPRSPPASCEAVLRRLGVEPLQWCQAVEHFAHWFHGVVGHVEQLRERMERAGKKWLQGMRACRDVFT